MGGMLHRLMTYALCKTNIPKTWSVKHTRTCYEVKTVASAADVSFGQAVSVRVSSANNPSRLQVVYSVVLTLLGCSNISICGLNN